MPYAEQTSVPVHRSKAEIEELLNIRAGASHVMTMTSPEGSMTAFQLEGRHYKINIPDPEPNLPEKKHAQEQRRIWRGVLLLVKALVVAHEDGLFPLERSMAGFRVLGNGLDVAETIQRLELEHPEALMQGNLNQKLLPEGGEAGRG